MPPSRKPPAARGAVPASLMTAWGLREAATRGPKPVLELSSIVEAAVTVATASGIEAVSMNRIASELGVGTMSLYRHVEGKSELLTLMTDAVFVDAPRAPRPRERWRTSLARWAREHLSVLRRHPWVVRIPISGPPLAPNQVRWFEIGLRCLQETGLGESEKLSVLLLLNGFVRNHALFEADLAAAAAQDGAVVPYGELLAQLIDSGRFPAVDRLVTSGAFERQDAPADDFEFGLQRILDGIEVFAARPRGPR